MGAELLAEVGGAVKAGAQGDLRNGQGGGLQQLFCPIDAAGDQIIHWRLPNAAAEAPQALPGTDGRCLGDLLQSQFFRIVVPDEGHHAEDPVLILAMLAQICAVGAFDHLQKQQPDLRKQISGLKFRILPGLHRRQLPQLLQKLPLFVAASPDRHQVDVLILGHGLQIFGLKHAFEMAPQKHGMKQVGIHDAPILVDHGGQHIAVDKEALALGEYLALAGGGDLHTAGNDVVEFQCLVPMPGHKGHAQVGIVVGIGVCVVQTLNVLHPVVPEGDLHAVHILLQNNVLWRNRYILRRKNNIKNRIYCYNNYSAGVKKSKYAAAKNS